MTMLVEVEKIQNSPFTRKKFRTDEVYKMMEIGILPEESGWELIDGELVDKMPIGSKHASNVKRLNRILTNLVGQNSIVSVQDPIHIDEHNEPERDIALLVPRDDFYAEAHPTAKDVLLVIEVSDSTLEYDRDLKKNLYAGAGIGEFWLINLQKNTIETFWNPTGGDYYEMRIYEQSETIQSKNIEYLTLPVSEILGENIINSETAEG